MSGGQLMAGIGQCQRIGDWHPTNTYGYWGPGYGYDGPRWGASAYAPYDYED
ncbi:hypothetical protein [Bradyrhizobium glycinis]|uniref:hypothetical protein n=1 Tax=Bradyrhizobium glycinis TaxID=2751812 RepID=UPI001FE25037|nr:hypothetical protein [Bradyrhizobium glycinis]